jgi:hypothetical protein
VEEFDQEIAPARAGAEQRLDLAEGTRIDLPAFGCCRGRRREVWGFSVIVFIREPSRDRA